MNKIQHKESPHAEVNFSLGIIILKLKSERIFYARDPSSIEDSS